MTWTCVCGVETQRHLYAIKAHFATCEAAQREWGLPEHRTLAVADADADDAIDEMAAKLEAAARWQCEPCDRLFKSPEEFMAHECPPEREPISFEEASRLARQHIADHLAYQAAVSSTGPAFSDSWNLIAIDALAESAAQTIAAQAPKPVRFSMSFEEAKQLAQSLGHGVVDRSVIGPPSRDVVITHIGRAPAVSDQAAKSIQRWRDAGGDDDE